MIFRKSLSVSSTAAVAHWSVIPPDCQRVTRAVRHFTPESEISTALVVPRRLRSVGETAEPVDGEGLLPPLP